MGSDCSLLVGSRRYILPQHQNALVADVMEKSKDWSSGPYLNPFGKYVLYFFFFVSKWHASLVFKITVEKTGCLCAQFVHVSLSLDKNLG